MGLKKVCGKTQNREGYGLQPVRTPCYINVGFSPKGTFSWILLEIQGFFRNLSTPRHHDFRGGPI
jgi:hypothetical protein